MIAAQEVGESPWQTGALASTDRGPTSPCPDGSSAPVVSALLSFVAQGAASQRVGFPSPPPLKTPLRDGQAFRGEVVVTRALRSRGQFH